MPLKDLLITNENNSNDNNNRPLTGAEYLRARSAGYSASIVINNKDWYNKNKSSIEVLDTDPITKQQIAYLVEYLEADDSIEEEINKEYFIGATFLDGKEVIYKYEKMKKPKSLQDKRYMKLYSNALSVAKYRAKKKEKAI